MHSYGAKQNEKGENGKRVRRTERGKDGQRCGSRRESERETDLEAETQTETERKTELESQRDMGTGTEGARGRTVGVNHTGDRGMGLPSGGMGTSGIRS